MHCPESALKPLAVCLHADEQLRAIVQAASTEADQGQAQPGPPMPVPETVSRTLHIQAAKVVTAHAASVGDPLLGVPLLCSAGGHSCCE